MRPELPVKLYYRIGEVAEVVGVEPHVLRYWESEFGTIRPQKSPKGQRVYSRRDLEKLLRVKELLYDEGYTIAGAKKRLRDLVSEQARAASQAAVSATLALSAPAPVTSAVAGPSSANATTLSAVPSQAVASPGPVPLFSSFDDDGAEALAQRFRAELVDLRATLRAELESLGQLPNA